MLEERQAVVTQPCNRADEHECSSRTIECDAMVNQSKGVMPNPLG